MNPVCLSFKDGIGLDAINDSFLLEAAIYRLLRRHCRDQPYYVHLLELFTEVLHAPTQYTGTQINTGFLLDLFLFQTSFQTELGQALDLMTSTSGQIDLNRFTLER